MIKKVDVGILTYHRAINYGAVLQAYALQRYLSKFGITSEIIDYRSSTIEPQHNKMQFSLSNHIISNLKILLSKKNYNKKIDNFDNFLSKEMVISEKITSKDQLDKIKEKYDKIIVGSDQVWNYKINNFDRTYFLDFAEQSQKYSYAASFGLSKIDDEVFTIISNLISSFKGILVREKSGSEIIRSMLGYSPDVVVDPTMLLDKSDWESMASENNHGRYVLVYSFGKNKTINRYARRISEILKIKIIFLGSNHKIGIKNIYNKIGGPKDFITLIRNAEYVITNSFHGTVFSIIFNKNFNTVFLDESRGINSRLSDLLETSGLNDRLLSNTHYENIDLKCGTIDYEIVNVKIRKQVELSKKSLNKILNSKMLDSQS